MKNATTTMQGIAQTAVFALLGVFVLICGANPAYAGTIYTQGTNQDTDLGIAGYYKYQGTSTLSETGITAMRINAGDVWFVEVRDGANCSGDLYYKFIFTYGATGIKDSTEIQNSGGTPVSSIDLNGTYCFRFANASYDAQPVIGELPSTAYFELAGSGGFTEGIGTTRIIWFKPEEGTTTENSTTIEGQVYIDPADITWISGVEVEITNTSRSYLYGNPLLSEKWMIPVTSGSGGYINFSTTTVLADGNYAIHVHIMTVLPLGSWGNLPDSWQYFSQSVSESTSTSNPVAQFHRYRVIQDVGVGPILNEGEGYYMDTIGQIHSTTSSSSLSHCNLLGDWDASECFVGLFMPPEIFWTSWISQIYNNVMTHWPWGYILRFNAIVQGSVATSSLPALSVTVPNNFPVAGANINLTPWGKLMGTSSYLYTATSTQTGKTLYETVAPYWTIFCYFMFGIFVIMEIMDLNANFEIDLSSASPFEKKSLKRKRKVTRTKDGRKIIGFATDDKGVHYNILSNGHKQK